MASRRLAVQKAEAVTESWYNDAMVKESVVAAWAATRTWFGLSRRLVTWPVVFVVAFYVTWRTGGDVAANQLAMSTVVSAIAVGVAAVFLFFYQIPVQYKRLEALAEETRIWTAVGIGEKRAMLNWLRNALSESHLHLTGVAAFGSVVKDYEADDLDLVVVYPRDSVQNHRIRVRRVLHKCRHFKEVFGVPIHHQPFYTDQTEQIHGFLKKANGHEVLFGAIGD